MAHPNMDRGTMIGRTLDAVEWLVHRRSPFKTQEFAEALDMSVRSACAWLNALEARGLVEHCGQSRRRHWRTHNGVQFANLVAWGKFMTPHTPDGMHPWKWRTGLQQRRQI